MKSFSGLFTTVAGTIAKEIMQKMEDTVSRRKYPLKESQFLRNENMALQKPVPEETNQFSEHL